MKLIVDANILFSLSKEDTTASLILLQYKPKLFAPIFALEELSKHKEEIIKKSGFNSLNSIILSLKNKVIFIEKSEYSKFLSYSQIKISDSKDMAYLALSLRLKSPIWSNDPHLKEQSFIEVFTTAELLELLEI